MNSLRVKLILEAIDRMTQPIRSMSDRFTQATIRMMQAAERLRAKVIQIGESAKQIGSNLSMSISAPILGLGTLAVRQSANFEKLKASLETVTGSQKAAAAAWEDILKFASTTPFQLEEVMSGYIKLKALGLDPSTESLRSFGNTASAMGKSLDQFIEAVADASTGEFERLKEFGIKANSEGKKVTFTFQGQSKTVGKNAAEITAYLKSIGEIQFAGAMEKQMNTLSGAFSNLQDSVSTSLAKVGDSIAANLNLKEFALDLSNAITSLAEGFQSLPIWMQGFIVKGGLILALIGPLIVFIAQFAIGLASMAYTFTLVAPALIAAAAGFKALGIAMLTTPIGWIIMAIAALAVAAYLLIKHWDKVKVFFINLWATVKDLFAKAIDFIMDRLWPFLEVIERVKSGVQSVRNLALHGFSGPPQGTNPGSSPIALGGAVPIGGAALGQKVDMGGTLNIKIDAQGQPRVSQASPNDKRLDYSVDTGLIMGTP